MTRERKPDHDLIDILLDELELKSDAELARELGLPYPAISKIRHNKINVSANTILKIYDATGWSIEKIRGYLPGSSVEE